MHFLFAERKVREPFLLYPYLSMYYLCFDIVCYDLVPDFYTSVRMPLTALCLAIISYSKLHNFLLLSKNLLVYLFTVLIISSNCRNKIIDLHCRNKINENLLPEKWSTNSEMPYLY